MTFYARYNGIPLTNFQLVGAIAELVVQDIRTNGLLLPAFPSIEVTYNSPINTGATVVLECKGHRVRFELSHEHIVDLAKRFYRKAEYDDSNRHEASLGMTTLEGIYFGDQG